MKHLYISENLKILIIDPVKEKSQRGCFYSSTDSDDCKSSELFTAFCQLPDKHQLAICSESKEMVFFLPSSRHQATYFPSKQQKKFRELLMRSMKTKPNNHNKHSKSRQVRCDKWIFYGKCRNLLYAK